MQVVARTDEYTIYKRRDERYAVRSAVKGKSGAWINGDEKVAVLRKHDLIKAPAPKPQPEPEAPAEADSETAATAADAAEADSQAGSDESESDEKDAG